MESIQFNSNTVIENQYNKPNLFEDILERLNDQGIDSNNITRSDIAGVDEFHVRGADVSKEIINGINLNEARVLDVGCGIGGPCRMLAEEFNCEVTGIDLSHEYIRTAQKLSELVGLQDKTKFMQGDALNLPFESGSFDVVWTQHVQMNINNKAKFYSEIARVLTDKGTLTYYDIFRKDKDDVTYPVPWANDASISFLGTIATTNNLLEDLDFIEVKTTDQTNKAIDFLNNLFEKIKKDGPPKLGLNVLMGSATMEKLGNILKGLNENKIVLQSGIYKKK